MGSNILCVHSKKLHRQISVQKFTIKDTVTGKKMVLSQDCTAFASCDPH